MDIKQQLVAAMKEAMQNKELVRKETIQMLRAAILQVEKDGLKELSEDEILTILAKESKKRKESLPDYEKAGREDIVSRINEEIKIIEVYLPERLTEAEITEAVKTAIIAVGATGMKDMGKVMGEIKAKTAGRADGKVVSEIVKAELSNI